jgi:Fe2+ or Zn2+ uptake regulation protein
MEAVSLVAKLHKTLQWLQNLQFVTEMFYQNGTSFISMNMGPEERAPILFCIKLGTAADLT